MIDPSGKVIGNAVDTWTLGCIAYTLRFGTYPFQNEHDILNMKIDYKGEESYMIDLIKLML